MVHEPAKRAPVAPRVLGHVLCTEQGMSRNKEMQVLSAQRVEQIVDAFALSIFLFGETFQTEMPFHTEL